MEPESFADNLKRQIEAKYRRRSDNLGWRLLYSPRQVLDGAQIALIGTNPGGSLDREDHAEFAMEKGSAYELEEWERAKVPGESPLQKQMLTLFSWLGEDPSHVLAGNLVPFRSPSWASLNEKSDALKFGELIWRKILARAKPSVVIGLGNEVHDVVCRILDVVDIERVPLHWGNIAGMRGRFTGGHYVGLPHLGRYKIMKRRESRASIEHLLGPCQWERR